MNNLTTFPAAAARQVLVMLVCMFCSGLAVAQTAADAVAPSIRTNLIMFTGLALLLGTGFSGSNHKVRSPG